MNTAAIDFIQSLTYGYAYRQAVELAQTWEQRCERFRSYMAHDLDKANAIIQDIQTTGGRDYYKCMTKLEEATDKAQKGEL